MDEKIKDHNTTGLIIRYKDANGQTTKRKISDIKIEGIDKINAHCHLRNETRTFWINNIVCIIDPETGNIDKDTWKYFNLSPFDCLTAQFHSILPAVKALKVFSILIRGFAKQERTHIVNFIIDYGGTKEIGGTLIDGWLLNVWGGPSVRGEQILAYDFQKGDDFQCLKPLIKEIPDELMEQCRDVALRIAMGSGRKLIPSDLIAWINENFSTPGKKRNTEPARVYVLKGKGAA